MRYSYDEDYEEVRPVRRAPEKGDGARVKSAARPGPGKAPSAAKAAGSKASSPAGSGARRAAPRAQGKAEIAPRKQGARPSGAPSKERTAQRARPTPPPPREHRGMDYEDDRPAPRAARPVKRSTRSRKKRGNPMATLAGILIAVALAFAISYFLHEYAFDIVRVSGDAMHETLMNGDLAVVTKFDYKEASPETGDIVAVRVGAQKGVILRRVIGVPGQTVEFTGSETLIDGRPLLEEYVSLKNYNSFPAKTLPHGKFYIAGDNRSELSDSRLDEVGLVSAGDIVGKVRMVIWPFNHLSSF